MEDLKKLPVGLSDFKKLIDKNAYFVDKSLLIKEIIDDISEVKLITRPRRFGKSLNLSILKYYFEKNDEDYSYLFENMKIMDQAQSYLDEQGKYPVINLTFKDIKLNNFDHCYQKIKMVISEEFKRHQYLLNSDQILEIDKKHFKEIMTEEAGYIRYSSSIELLSKLLFKHYNQEVIILLDEYDTPINYSYLNNYYEEIIEFMRMLLSSAFKDNQYLNTGIITGIYRVAKESIFSGFNNLRVSSIIDKSYSQFFGFTEDEVLTLLKYYNKDSEINKVRQWYNGYRIGNNIDIYNPWSILNYLANDQLKSYWTNSSSNDLIREMLVKSNSDFKIKMQRLLIETSIKDIEINTDSNFKDIENKKIINEGSIWNLLLLSGYLKVVNIDYSQQRNPAAELKIPNLEVENFYHEIIMGWFEQTDLHYSDLEESIVSLINGEIDDFKEQFQYIVESTFSYFDVGKNNSENFYHAFVLGLLVNLSEHYRIKSNTETGTGRADILIIPQNKKRFGIVIEFKVARDNTEAELKKAAKQAIGQIIDKDYGVELKASGVEKIINLAVVFSGKKVYIESENE
ncbi:MULTISPECIES: AAA family ATPase [Halanaerobium]|jgi:hypothetical protein|uniref:PD-(D/E)XK nuclease superfamily protein n=1 Tax=Halanaerobium congolense TaxID=54121 RepID=A0A1G6KM17_9FIRM|nr:MULTISPECIES: AAA family ATPase [Halanaerobium]PUU90214.1 MAG: ATPase AAA [Halanaerobium sp.]PXV64040.1 PD-(D/E)XK nuclease superfamily protein [Halanaerobium congolense]SDC32119.1 PD-(D/E)XK nuclease superfamily protein [Halanaerobium congolense]